MNIWSKVLDRRAITLMCLLFGYSWICVTHFVLGASIQSAEHNSFMRLSMEFGFVTVATVGLYTLLMLRDKKISLSHLYSKTILETARVGISVVNEDGIVKDINHTYAEMFGYSKSELIGQPFIKLIPEKGQEEARIIFSEVLKGNRNIPREWALKKQSGEKVYAICDVSLLETTDNKKLVITSLTDITEQKKIQHKLNDSLKEKEILISEIHHRVKNNLSLITSLMHLQTCNSTDDVVNNKLCECVSRIHTIAAIHELLYRSGNFSRLKLDQSLSDLLKMITDTYGVNLDLKLRMPPHKINLNINQAIPYLLIVNEALLQIINQQENKLMDNNTLHLEMNEIENRVYMKIRDSKNRANGNGKKIDFNNIDKLGSLLIDTLAQQLEAEIDPVHSDQNTLFALNFSKNNSKGIGNAHLS